MHEQAEGARRMFIIGSEVFHDHAKTVAEARIFLSQALEPLLLSLHLVKDATKYVHHVRRWVHFDGQRDMTGQ